MKTLTHFSLFSGIGGLDLAAEWAGFETVGQCEWADYPTKVLEKHWPNVPRWRDIRDVTRESVRQRIEDPEITVISGGFPCQPFSVAGKQRGKEDDRYLWPEMLRVIEELRPTWVLGENVVGIVRLALDQVLSDLESKGYATIPIIVPACSVNAPHRRERVFILANSRCSLRQRPVTSGTDENEIGKGDANLFERSSEMVSDSSSIGRKKSGDEARDISKGKTKWESWTANSINRHIWESEPNVGRVANGISSRMDRLKCLGNAVVPQQVYPILKAIAEIERMINIE